MICAVPFECTLRARQSWSTSWSVEPLVSAQATPTRRRQTEEKRPLMLVEDSPRAVIKL